MILPLAHRIALTVGFVLALTPVFQAKSAPLPYKWQVLVLEQTSLRIKDRPARWSTIWSDGVASKVMDGAVASLGGSMCRLKTTVNRDRASCAAGKFPFSYEVDELVAEPISGGPARPLLGHNLLVAAREIMKEHLAGCDGIKALPFAPDTTESYERAKINLLSVYNNTLGVELLSESLAYGRPQALVSNDWGAYLLDKECSARVAVKALPTGVVSQATSKFVKLSAGERDPYSPADLSHYVLVPQGGGVRVEFGVPATAESAKGTVRQVSVDSTSGPADDYNKLRQSFVASHPKLAPWNDLTFYTIAPDGSAIVFAQDGNLYWRALKGKAKLIGQAKNVRGWQWHKGS